MIVSFLRPTMCSEPSALHAPRSPVRRTAPAAGATVGPLTSISPSPASVTRVQNSGAPSVVTCEHASVSPYVAATGTPAAAARAEQRRR